MFNTIVLVLLSLLTLVTLYYLLRFSTRVASRMFWLYVGPEEALKLFSMDKATVVWQDLEPMMSFCV